MRKRILSLSFASLVSVQPLYGVIVPNEPHGYHDSSATSAPNLSQAEIAQLSELKKNVNLMTPEQRDSLLKQSKNLNPEQLQAIAKSFQQQVQTQAPAAPLTSQTTPTASAASASIESPMNRNTQRTKSLEEMKREQAFNMLLDEVLPMSPDQIKQLHKFYDLTLQAKATPPTATPIPHVTSKVVHLDPGSETPVIRLAAGFITSVLFVDSTGEPWKLTAYSLGDPSSFNIQWDQKGNTIFIQSLKPYAHANLAVRLWGLDTPVMLTLVSGQKNVDFRVDLQIGERGPDAKPVVVDTTFDAKVNPLLINVLDGIPPKGSIKLGVHGGNGEAWVADNKIYFRSKLTVLSPAWLSTVASPDGTHVYELMLTPYIVASQNGKTVDIKLSGL